jgi:hypothetical protein
MNHCRTLQFWYFFETAAKRWLWFIHVYPMDKIHYNYGYNVIQSSKGIWTFQGSFVNQRWIHWFRGEDGSVLLSEMQIQHPTASMIARAASAQARETRDTRDTRGWLSMYRRYWRLERSGILQQEYGFKNKKAWQVHVENTVADSHRMKNFLIGT